MTKTATFTFHASHNYGSMLQAYALQRVIYDFGYENEIVNLRTIQQKKLYNHPNDTSNLSIKKKLLHYTIERKYETQLINKYNKFEYFLNNYLNITTEINSEKDFSSSNYDYLIAGSDQIWNLKAEDFSWAYFLPYENAHLIAYAPSCGKNAKHNSYDTATLPQIRKCLSQFKMVSVRDQRTAELVYKATGIHPQIVLDPTMLKDKLFWDTLTQHTNIVNQPYIYLYTIGFGDAYPIAEKISKLLDLPIVVSELHTRSLIKYRNIKRILDIGPLEFLNLIKNAEIVISGSFHAIMFSIIFGKPFLIANGDKDDRMNYFLQKFNLTNRTISPKECELSKDTILDNSDIIGLNKILNLEREKSIHFLNKALDIHND